MSAKRKSIDRRAATFGERLDAAVMNQFPNVGCETEYSIFSMSHVTHWYVKGSVTDDQPVGQKLPLALAKQVRAFVQGFSAAEECKP